MFHPSSIQPDLELRDFLRGKITVGEQHAPVTVYRDWERPTNGLPTDFVVVYMNGNMRGLGTDVNFAKGNIMVGLYCRLNDDGSVKINRVNNILTQFDTIIQGLTTKNYHFEYEMPQFITPTNPNQTSGYSITVLNLRWTTNVNFSKAE